MIRFFLLLTGFGFAVVGGVSVIAYLNLLTAGYSYQEYLLYIKERPECYLSLCGFLFLYLAISMPPQTRSHNRKDKIN
ncbi:hypothetical protein ACFOU2_09505 [Bacillus songklensis]|uniref:Uncharacterized protein n=1 Tax=Bacillus songklensis TaxID=1069116 RepID=A0ABV8B1D2_9BACI